jgi:hypothetical protein
MLLKKGSLVGQHRGHQRRVVDREVVGVVVPGDAAGCAAGDQRGVCGVHQVLPVANADEQRRIGVADALIASVAGATYPHIEALSKVAMQTTVEEDFNSGLRMLLDGIATRRPRKRR